MRLVLSADYVQNKVRLCKLDIYVKNRMAVAGSAAFFKLELKLFKGKSVISISTLKIKCGKSKGLQEKVSIMGVWCG